MTGPRRHGGRPRIATHPVPEGVVKVEPANSRWFLVAIGRARTVKRFNITRTEAWLLVEALSDQLLPEDEP